jgi:hypothetical protein
MECIVLKKVYSLIDGYRMGSQIFAVRAKRFQARVCEAF